jgi:hypothetical protein
VPGAAPVSSQRLQASAEHYGPVLNHPVEHRGIAQSAIFGGLPLSAICAKPSAATAAARPNPHRPPTPHRFPRVRSSEAFGRRPLSVSAALTGPASETLTDPRPSRPRPGMARFHPLQTFITTPAASRVGCEADIRAGLIHVGATRSLEQSLMPAEPLTCNYSPLCGNRRLSQFVEQHLGFFQIGGVKAFGEPTGIGREKVAGLIFQGLPSSPSLTSTSCAARNASSPAGIPQ